MWPCCSKCATNRRRISAVSISCCLPRRSCVSVGLGGRAGVGDGPVPAAVELGCPMRHRARAARATRFPSRPCPGRPRRGTAGRRRRAPPSRSRRPSAVKRLGGAAAPDHRVDPGAGPGDEPEPAAHAASSSSGRRRRAARRAPSSRRAWRCVGARRCLRARLTSRRISNRIRLRVSGDSARRTPWPSDAALTTRLAQHEVGEQRPARSGVGTPRLGAGLASPRSGDRRTRLASTGRRRRGAGVGQPALERRRRWARSVAASARARSASSRGRVRRPHAPSSAHDQGAATTQGQHGRRAPGARASCGITVPTLSRGPSPTPPRISRRIRSQRSLTAASAPSAVGW